MRKPPPCPFSTVLLVQWHDASASGLSGEWEALADIAIKPCINYSVGFYLEEQSTDDILVLCLNTTSDPPIDVGELIQIPRGMVMSETKLYPRKKPRPKPEPHKAPGWGQD